MPSGVLRPQKQAALPQSQALGHDTGFTDFITRKGAEGKEESKGSDKLKEVLVGIREG